MDKLLVFLLTPVDCLKMQEFVHSTWRRHGGLRSPLCGEAVVAQLHIVLFMAKLCSETEIVFAHNLFNPGSLWELQFIIILHKPG